MVVGANLRRVRDEIGVSLADLATTGQSLGMKWSASAVSQIESGKYRPTVELLAILVRALNFQALLKQGRRTVTIADLLRTDYAIAVSDSHSMTAEKLLEFLAGHEPEMEMDADAVTSLIRETTTLRDEIWRHAPSGLREAVRESKKNPPIGPITEQETRAARDLGIPPISLQLWSFHLWGKTFEAERDARAGQAASAQKRGRVTREMKSEIRKAREAEHGND